MAVPYTFQNATGSLPLSQLDTNFATGITIGNTSVVLGDTITLINNMSLANVAINSVSVAFPNGYLANSSVTLGNTSVSLGSTATTLNGLTLSNVTISTGNVTINTATVTTANVTTLNVSGNTTLGDASSDTVTINSTTTFNASPVISVTDNTNAALRITQLGTGNAFIVEDSTNPDATPFVIDASGNTFIKYGTSLAPASLSGGDFEVNSAGSTQANIVAGQWTASTSGSAQIVLTRSLSGVRGTQTIVTTGTALGKVRSFGSDGTNFIEATSIESYVDGTPGTNDMPGRLVFSTTADGASSVTERLRISSAGVTTFTGTGIINANTSTDALRITQLGAGNALLVEDSTNPDATPFVVDATGAAVIGATTVASLTISGAPQLSQGGTTATSARNAFSRWDASATGFAMQFGKSRGGATGTFGIVSSGDSAGQLQFFGDDGTAFVSLATISANVDGTPGVSDMPGRLTFNTTADGASSVTERMRIDNAGNAYVETGTLWQYAPAPTAKAAAATLTAAELRTGILSTTGTTYTITLPTGTDIDAGWTSAPTTGIGFDWYVVNTASGTVTIAVGASGMTSLGTLTIATGVSAHFRFRRTAANTYVLYRLV
jgi:hypothetical protein